MKKLIFRILISAFSVYFSYFPLRVAHSDDVVFTPDQTQILMSHGVLLKEAELLLKYWPGFSVERMAALSDAKVPLTFFIYKKSLGKDIFLTDQELIQLVKQSGGKLVEYQLGEINDYKKNFPDTHLDSAKINELIELVRKYTNFGTLANFARHYKKSNWDELAEKVRSSYNYVDKFFEAYPDLPMETALGALGRGFSFSHWHELKKLKPSLNLELLLEELSNYPDLNFDSLFYWWEVNPNFTLAQIEETKNLGNVYINNWKDPEDPKILIEKLKNFKSAGLPLRSVVRIRAENPNISFDEIYNFWNFMENKGISLDSDSDILNLVPFLSKEQAYDYLENKKIPVVLLEKVPQWGYENVERLQRKCQAIGTDALESFMIGRSGLTPHGLELFCQFRTAHPNETRLLREIKEDRFFPDAIRLYDAFQPNSKAASLIISLIYFYPRQFKPDLLMKEKDSFLKTGETLMVVLDNSNLSLPDVLSLLKKGLTLEDLKKLTDQVKALDFKAIDALIDESKKIERLREIWPYLQRPDFNKLSYQKKVKVLDAWNKYQINSKNLDIFMEIPLDSFTSDQVQFLLELPRVTSMAIINGNIKLESDEFSFLHKTLPIEYLRYLDVLLHQPGFREALQSKKTEVVLDLATRYFEGVAQANVSRQWKNNKSKLHQNEGAENPWETTDEALRTFYQIDLVHHGRFDQRIKNQEWQRNPIEVLMRAGSGVQILGSLAAPIEPPLTKKMFISVPSVTEFPRISEEVLDQLKQRLFRDLSEVSRFPLTGNWVQDLVGLKKRKVSNGTYLAFLRLAPFIYSYSNEHRFRWPLAEIELSEKLTVGNLRNMYLGFFQNQLIPEISENPDLKSLKQHVDVVNREWVEKLIRQKAVPFGKEEVVISGEVVPPGVSTLRACLAEDCTLYSAPFIGLHKDVKVFFLRKSYKWDSRPEGYALVLELQHAGKTIPYILTIHAPEGGYSETDTLATLKMIAHYYKSDRFFIPNQKHELHGYFINNSHVKSIFKELASKGTHTAVEIPVGLGIVKALTEEDNRKFRNYYAKENIEDPVLVEERSLELGTESSYVEVLSANRYLPPKNFQEAISHLKPEEREKLGKEAASYLEAENPLRKQINRALGLDKSVRSVSEFVEHLKKTGNRSFISDHDMQEVIAFLQDPHLIFTPSELGQLGSLFWKRNWGRYELPSFASKASKKAFLQRIRETLFFAYKNPGNLDTLSFAPENLAYLSKHVENLIKLLGSDFEVLRQDMVPAYLKLIEKGIYAPHLISEENNLDTSDFLIALTQAVQNSPPKERGLLAQELWDSTRNLKGDAGLQMVVDHRLKSLLKENPIQGPKPKEWEHGERSNVTIPTDKLMVRRQQGGACFAETASYLFDYWRFYIEGDPRTNVHASALAGNIESTACQLEKGKVIHNLSYFNPDLVCPHFEQMKKRGACPRDILEEKLDSKGKSGTLRGTIDSILSLYKSILDKKDQNIATFHQPLGCLLNNFVPGVEDASRDKFIADVNKILELSLEGKDHEGIFMQKILNYICPASQRVFIDEKVSCRNESSNLKQRLNNYFSPSTPEPRFPMGVGFCGQLLKKGKGFRGNEPGSTSAECGPHAVMLAGRKKGLRNHWLIGLKNTWGKDCEGISQDWICGPDGVVWVDQEDFLKNLKFLIVISK